MGCVLCLTAATSGYQGLEQKMTKTTEITQKQIRAFMAARYPEAKHVNASCSWSIGKSYCLAMSDDEVKDAALAEIEAWKDGIAIKPEWVDA